MSRTESSKEFMKIEPMPMKDKKVEFSARLNKTLDSVNFAAKGKGRQGLLGKAFGVSQKGARKWLEGEAIPRHATLVSMADRFGVNANWLEYGDGPMHNQLGTLNSNVSEGPDIRGYVPLISWVQAGSWHEAEDHYLPGDAEEFLPCPVSHGLGTYALRVAGDSMTASHGKSYPEGCVIYVDPSQAGGVSSGDRVIAKINGDAKVTFKQFIDDAGVKFLKPLNPQYPTIHDPFRIIGKIIGKWEDE